MVNKRQLTTVLKQVSLLLKDVSLAPPKGRQKTIFQVKFNLTFRSLACRKQVADVPYRFLLPGSIKCKIEAPLFSNNKICFLETKFFHLQVKFYEGFLALLATEEQYITWQKEESIFYLPELDNEGWKPKLTLESFYSKNPNPQQQLTCCLV